MCTIALLSSRVICNSRPASLVTMASSSSAQEEVPPVVPELAPDEVKKTLMPLHQTEVSTLVQRLGFCTAEQAWLTFIFSFYHFANALYMSYSFFHILLFSHEHIFYFSSFVNRPQLSTPAFSERSKLKYQCLYILWFSFSVVHSLLYDTFSISHHVHSSIDEHMPYFSFFHSSIFSFVHSFLFSSKDDVFLIFTFSAVCIHSLLQAIATYLHR